MAWTSSLKAAAIVAGLALPAAAAAAPRTFVYSVNHSHYGDIGTYERTIDQTGDVTRARSRLLIAVKMMGMVVHRERDDQTEVWRDRRLVSFNSVSDTAGQRLAVSGEASAGKFVITSPSGTTTAPADVAAADPWGLDHVGRGQAVSIKSGKVEQVDVIGGQPERIVVGGVAMQVRHFSASTASQPDKWDVWIDRDGVPVKFRSREGKAMVDFTLVSPNPAGGPLAEARLAPGG